MHRVRFGLVVVVVWFTCFLARSLYAQEELTKPPKPSEVLANDDVREHWTSSLDRHALIALPLATALGTLLALRPRRKGTPHRSPPVIQTQIILSLIGCLVMLVVGSSLARAFGVVGAAGLVRYRAKIEDPKDAGVMLSTLAVGLACGVGVYLLAVFAAVFIGAVLYVVESFEPSARKYFTLEVKAKDAGTVKSRVEALMRRRRVRFELREASPEEVSYEVELPLDLKTDTLSAEIMQLDSDDGTAVNWSPEKKKTA
jgi:MgtC family/Domain of unknown function (DUF4956)